MEQKNLVVFGIYLNQADLEAGVSALKEAGFRSGDISALLPTPEGTKEFSHTKGTKMPEGAATGAATGAVLGGTLGWLAGIGAIAIPGLGPFIAAGPIMGLLAGAAAGGVSGGLVGALVGLGLPEYEAQRYQSRVKEGGYLLSVHCDDEQWRDRAKRILERTNAKDISSTKETRGDQTDRNKDRPAANY